MKRIPAGTIDGVTGKLDPPPRIIHLKTADDARLEMSRVYRDMRLGSIEMGDGTRLAYVLTQLIKAIESGLIEHRLESLEKILTERKQLS